MIPESDLRKPLLLTRILPHKTGPSRQTLGGNVPPGDPAVLLFRSRRGVGDMTDVAARPDVLLLTTPVPEGQGWCDLLLQDSFEFRPFAASRR